MEIVLYKKTVALVTIQNNIEQALLSVQLFMNINFCIPKNFTPYIIAYVDAMK
jgi:hypothetical protein